VSRAFLDTSVLIYAYSAGDPRLFVARRLIVSGGTISVQSLNEFVSIAVRKLKMPWPDVHRAVTILHRFCKPVASLDVNLHLLGLRIAEERQLSLYDSMIIAAALIAGCDTLYSEDMQHGLVIDEILTITNPFR
jgi:predicted nucleic acid-binding protein